MGLQVTPDARRRRYVVTSVTGFWIDERRPAERGSGGAGYRGNPPTSYYVLDRAYAYSVVGDFTAEPTGRLSPHGATELGRGNNARRRLAEDLAAKLNAWDEENGLVELPPLEATA